MVLDGMAGRQPSPVFLSFSLDLCVDPLYRERSGLMETGESNTSELETAAALAEDPRSMS